MRKIFIAVVITLLCLPYHVYAADKEHTTLIIETIDTKTVLSLETLKLTITHGVLTATNSVESKSFPLSNLVRMYFSKNDASKLLTPQNEIESTSEVINYDVLGRRVPQIPTQKGIFIIKNSGKNKIVITK